MTTLIVVFLLVAHAVGIANAAHAVLNVRSAPGAIAWVISLIAFPYVAIPLYWIIGRSKFYGYAEAHRIAGIQYQELMQQLDREIYKFKVAPPDIFASLAKLAEILVELPFTAGNAAQLLIDGEETFSAILSAIEAATDYILIQFYIVRDDQIGKEFKRALIAKARQGVRIYFIYDEIGSHALPKSYLKKLSQSGIKVTAFNSIKGKGNRFQINFRNHRKIVVVDGKQAFIGGLNIGDDYLGKDRRLSPWRDTHLLMRGPAVQCIQIAFLKDWYWAVREFPKVRWQVEPIGEKNETALVLPTGPGDKLDSCSLFLVSLINTACTRFWVASPYFVPNESVLTALKLAALRGVDVRILLPDRPDHLFVYLASFSYAAEMQSVGVKVYRYTAGFMHQKVMLVDGAIAGVGTVNLDNRSFQLNFEIMAFIVGSGFVASVERMLQADFAASSLVKPSDYEKKTFWFKLAVRGACLLSPLL